MNMLSNENTKMSTTTKIQSLIRINSIVYSSPCQFKKYIMKIVINIPVAKFRHGPT